MRKVGTTERGNAGDSNQLELDYARAAAHAVPPEPKALGDCLPASLRESPKGWGQGPVGLNSLRGVVSKKKRRFQRDGFDLDLSYITPQLIAMGFPSVGSEARYRNPMDQVQAFFQR